MKIPGAERAIVSEAKVRDYLLSAEHRVGSAKARFFTQLGFEQRNWEMLQSEVHRFATYEAHLGAATNLDRNTSCPVRYRDRPGAVHNWLSCGLC